MPLHKIPGEQNGADLTTKHWANPVIEKHIVRLNLEFCWDRAVKAARFHTTLKAARQNKVEAKEVRSCSSFS